MAKNSKIEWTDHTFNPWIGCTKISQACDNCYAEAWDQRYEGGIHWGPKAERRRTSAQNWTKPILWDEEARRLGIRYRVFCASLGDVFDNAVPSEWRVALWDLIRQTPALDWLLLTKRPQNIPEMLPDDWGVGFPNVWLGATVENQKEAERRIPILASIPATRRFLSCEPLLEPVNLMFNLIPFMPDKDRHCPGPLLPLEVIHWVIAGGETGVDFRYSDEDNFRRLRDQCEAAGRPFFFKQWPGRFPGKAGRELDGREHNETP